MTDSEVTRNEFNGAIEGIRREIHAMGQNLKDQLSQILRQLEATSEDSKKVATLEARVDGMDKRLDSAQNTARLLMAGLATSLMGHLSSSRWVSVASASSWTFVLTVPSSFSSASVVLMVFTKPMALRTLREVLAMPITCPAQ